MPLVSRLVEVGLKQSEALHLGFDCTEGATAAGNNSQANGTAVTTNITRFTTVTAGSADSATLMAIEDCPAGIIYVQNDGAGTLNLFPASGEKFNAQSANARHQIASGAKGVFFACESDTWLGGSI